MVNSINIFKKNWRYKQVYKKKNIKFFLKNKPYLIFKKNLFWLKRLKFEKFIINNFNPSAKIWAYILRYNKVKTHISIATKMFSKPIYIFSFRRKIWLYNHWRYIFIIKKKWFKKRKKWKWHRFIKKSVSTNTINQIKKMFFYKLVVKKYFHLNKINSYEKYKNIFLNQIDKFLVLNRLIPILKLSKLLCNNNKIIVNNKLVISKYIVKNYDIINFFLRNLHIRVKINKLFSKKKVLYNKKIYNKKINAIIQYHTPSYLHGRERKMFTYNYFRFLFN
jgi:ribosomal 50S subunit-recycling heat shock protein